VTSHTVTGLSNGTAYNFVVTATNGGGTSGNSNPISATPIAPPPAPVLNTATAGNAQVTLAWTAVTGAASYSVQYGTVTGVYGTPEVVGNLSSYTVTGLTNGTTYYFVVTATNAGATSGNSNELHAVPVSPPAAPVLNTAAAGNGQVALSWASSTGATSYSIAYGTTPGVYGAPAVVGNVTSYTVNNLTNGTPYYFVVTASNTAGTSTNSNEISATPVLPAPATPVLQSAASGNAQVTLSWGAVTGAASYSVEFGTVAGVYGPPVVLGNVTSYTRTGLTNGTAYYFVVAASNSTATSNYSNVLSATPNVVPVLNTATANNNQATLNWTQVPGQVSLYEILYGTQHGVYPSNIIVSGSASSGTVTGLTNGTKYYFVVSAEYSTGPSGYSNELSATPQLSVPAAPVLNSVTAGDAQVTLAWPAVTGAASYSVEYGTVPGVYEVSIEIGNLTSYAVTGLTNGTKYYFAVTATNLAGTSANSNELNAIPQLPIPAAPVLNTATAGNAQVELTWDAVAGATSYSVGYGTTNGLYGTPVIVGNATKYLVSSLANGKTYYFVVTATNAAGGTSNNSNELNATPQVPVPPAPVLNTAIAGNAKVALSWGAASGATSYSVAYGTAIGVYGTSVIVGNVTSYTVSGLTNGTVYYFVVFAADAGGTSASSNELNATPQVAPAIITQPASVTVTVLATATFRVAATGTPAPTYQWMQEAPGASIYTAISGATSASYTTAATTTSDSGTKYKCVVTNTAGTVTSTAATLTVNPTPIAPSITTQPTSATVTAPATTTFTVAATGTPTPTYKWMREYPKASSYVPIVIGATNASYTTPSTTTSDSGTKYKCVVTNTAGTVTSTAATLTVNPTPVAPSITIQPMSIKVTAPATAVFKTDGGDGNVTAYSGELGLCPLEFTADRT